MKKFNKNNKNAVDPRFIEDYNQFKQLYEESIEPFMLFLKEQVLVGTSEKSFMYPWLKFPLFKDAKTTKEEKLKLLNWIVDKKYRECIAEFPFHLERAMDEDPEYRNTKEVHFNYIKTCLDKIEKRHSVVS